MKSIVLIAAVLVIAGCASVPMADSGQDARAKTFAVAPGKANIYVYRNEILGAALKLPVALDGTAMGQTAAKSYFAFEVAPGQHVVATDESSVAIDAAPGKSYFVWQEVKMGLLAGGAKLQLVDETRGRAGVNECTLIASATGLSAGAAPEAASATSAGATVEPAAPAASATAAPAAAPAAVSAPVAAPSAAPAPLIQQPVYRQRQNAAGKPVARGKFEFEAERAAIDAGCRTADGARPTATLIDAGVEFEAFDVACSGRTMKVRCEALVCTAR